MTARPDEVVAWIEVTDTPYGEGLSFSDAANQPRGRYVQESALQSANARLAESEAERDAMNLKLSEVEIAHGKDMEAAERIVVKHNALAAVVRALADNVLDLTCEEMADKLRRAAAGEGDANQGDGK